MILLQKEKLAKPKKTHLLANRNSHWGGNFYTLKLGVFIDVSG